MYKIRFTNSLGVFESDVLEDDVDDIYCSIANSMKSSEAGVLRVNSKEGYLVLPFDLMKQSVVEIIEVKK